MNRIITLLSYFSCFLFLSQHALAQSQRFERPVKGPVLDEGSMPVAVFQHPTGDYFTLAGSGYHYTISKLDAEGHEKKSVLSLIAFETFPMTDLGYTGSRILAIGGGPNAPTKLLSLDLDLGGASGASLTNNDTRSPKVVGMPDNSVRALVGVRHTNGYWNMRLYTLSAALAITRTDMFVVNANIDPVGIFAAANNDAIVVGRNVATGNPWIVRVNETGTPVTAPIMLPEDVLDAKFYDDRLYVLTRSDDGVTARYTTIDAQGNTIARDLLTTTSAISNNTRLAVASSGEIAVSLPSTGPPGFDLYRFSADGVLVSTTSHSLSFNSNTWPAAMAAAQEGYVILAGTGDSSAPLSVVIKTDAQGEGLAPLFAPPNSYGLEQTETGQRYYQWIDFNGDGRRELVITNSGSSLSVYQYNPGPGLFQSIASPFPGAQDNIASLSAADIDNDGDIDVYANRFVPTYYDPEPLPNILYRNNGNGTYTAEQGVLSPAGIATRHSFWLDLNNDQWLDLYLSGARGDKAFINQGDGIHFTPLNLSNLQTKEDLAIPYPWAVAWDDLNNDGYIDLVSSTYDGVVNIALNQQGTGFVNVPVENYFSYNTPDNLFMVVQGIVKGMYQGKRTMVFGASYSGIDRTLYFEHNGTRYVQKELPNGAWRRGQVRDGEYTDFDNDGNLDLYFSGVTGTPPYTHHWFNHYDGDTTYTPRNFSLDNFRDFTWHDFDGDGALELVGPGKVYKVSTSNHSLRVRLRGQVSPTAGIGARVSLKVNGKWQHRTITTDLGHNGQVGDEALFGMGQATMAEELVVTWPSGCETHLANLGHGETVTVTEQCSTPKPTVAVTAPLCADEPVMVTFSPSGILYNWYTSMSLQEAPFAESASTVALDTLTKARTYYVANADGEHPSRRAVVYADPAAPARPDVIVGIVQDNRDYSFTAINDATDIEQYQWYVDDEPIVGGKTATILDPSVGPHTVCVDVTRGSCVARECSEFTQSPVFVTGEEEYALAGYDIFPNPIKDRLTIRRKSGQAFNIELLHVTGARTYSASGQDTYEVRTTEYAPGVYILRVNGLEAIRIVKQ
jgi:hypothetical protein